MLNPNAQQWVDALRSGEYGQGCSTKTFHFVQKLVRRPHVQTRVNRVEFYGGGASQNPFGYTVGCNRNCIPSTATLQPQVAYFTLNLLRLC